MSVSDGIVRGTLWLALAAFVASEGGRTHARRTGRPLAWALPVYAVGATLCALHFVASFHWHHQWSDARALEFTARQTAELYGLAWGGGLWVNCVFIGASLAETIRWARHPGYAARAGRRHWALRALYALIIVNAAVVFPQGPVRGLGALLVVLLAIFWFFPRGSAAKSA